jgi:parallel beta-helix repeat protein
MVAAVFAVVPLNIGATEEPEAPEEPNDPIEEDEEYWIDANGTYFEITDSEYLNITIISSENIKMHLESIPKMISFHIESNCNATSTEITISGFEASKTYYRYQEGNLLEEFCTDETGSYSYIQDISTVHHVFIQEMVATIYILSDGTINPSSAPIIRSGETFTLTDNIGDSIYIQREGITLDGAGFTVDGPGSGNGIYMDHMTSVTIKNLNIIDFTYGIYLSYSSYSTIDSITVTGNSHLGIYLFRSGYSTVTNNDVTGINYGIFLIRSGSSTLTNNIVAGNRNIGIRLSYSSSSTLTDNTVTGNGDAGIDLRNSGYSTLTATLLVRVLISL